VIAPWSLPDKDFANFKNKKVVCSIYHIEDVSRDSKEIKKIQDLDKFIDAYHTISNKTKDDLEKITDKPIYSIPLWVNQNIWYFIKNKNELRKKYNFEENDFLVGSFQRDTEGKDLFSPKLVKGPDIFIEIVNNLFKKNKNLKIVLAGKRRQYVISELEKKNIPFFYFEMTDFKVLNELYNTLNLYLVTSRLEGGPQALVECGLTKTPIISTDVGIANEILPPSSIFDQQKLSTFDNKTPDVDFAFEKSSKLTIPNGMLKYVEMFMEVYED
jgi:glycosyltransferase involved in cell wall biosynthesis